MSANRSEAVRLLDRRSSRRPDRSMPGSDRGFRLAGDLPLNYLNRRRLIQFLTKSRNLAECRLLEAPGCPKLYLKQPPASFLIVVRAVADSIWNMDSQEMISVVLRNNNSPESEVAWRGAPAGAAGDAGVNAV